MTSQFTAEELITKREDARAMMKNLMMEKMQKWNIIVEEVNIVNFDFSETFNAAIESKMVQVQASLSASNKLSQIEFEAKQTIAKAEGDKNAKIASAQGDAESIKIINEQLRQSPQYIEYLKVARWDGKLSYVSGAATPLVSIG